MNLNRPDAERIAVAMRNGLDNTDLAVERGAALERVRALVEKWENATELDTGRPSIVTRAFAAEVRKALEGNPIA